MNMLKLRNLWVSLTLALSSALRTFLWQPQGRRVKDDYSNKATPKAAYIRVNVQ